MSTPEQIFNIALRYYQAGELRQAEQLYHQILQEDPHHLDALHMLGLVAVRLGKHVMACNYIRQALRIKPDLAEAHSNLGNILLEMGQLDEAVNCYREAIRLKPHFADGHSNLGNALRQQGKLEAAATSLREALRLKPDFADAHNHMASVLRDEGKLEEAVTRYKIALRLKPNFVAAHSNLANALREQGKLNEAKASLELALHLQPDFADAHSNLGNVHRDQGNLNQAVACSRRALLLKPENPEFHSKLGIGLKHLHRLDEALTCFQQALRVNSDYVPAHVGRAHALLLAGDYAQGWPEYEWRWKTKTLKNWRVQTEAISPQPPWDGGPLTGRTILLKTEQGLGDTLQFIRYAPLIQQRGARVVVWSYTPLLSLLRTCPGIHYVLACDEPPPAFDVQTSLLSLPGLLGTTLATVPADVPYLSADPVLVAHWRRELSTIPGFKIGIVWQGRPGHEEDRFRSVPLTAFAPLARLEGVHLFSLQVGPGSEQIAALAGRFPVTDLGSRFDPASFADAAAVVKNLDLVVTVDTALAHLAGALGSPVWLALPFSPDWRWLLGREDSPWYPSMRLFRQPQPGQWPAVFERIAEETRKLLHANELPDLFEPDGHG